MQSWDNIFVSKIITNVLEDIFKKTFITESVRKKIKKLFSNTMRQNLSRHCNTFVSATLTNPEVYDCRNIAFNFSY